MSQAYLYIVESDATNADGLIKIGLTIHPVHRMRQYNIGDAPRKKYKKRYNSLWLTTANSNAEIHAMEKIVHDHFVNFREKAENGNYTEWFQVSSEEIAKFIDTQDFIVKRIPADEISDIHTKASVSPTKEDDASIKGELELMEEQKKEIESMTYEQKIAFEEYKLLQMFLEVFLNRKAFRKNQADLWTIFYSLCKCADVLNYRGIVQWPTGTGKTFAMLMLFVISAERCKKKGIIFRGLLVAPQNNIFDTIIHHIKKLSHFGIIVCEGHNQLMSTLHIPHDRPVLITATHAVLTNEEVMKKLPSITHCHYDEVHRIVGEEFFELLKEYLAIWKSEFLTGTSATPKTANPTQHKKILELFGNPLTILHKCGFDDAISSGWIAHPRFTIDIVSNNQNRQILIRIYLQKVRAAIEEKIKRGKWKGGKIICYLPLREEVCLAINIAKEEFPSEWPTYTAVEGADTSADDKFVSDTPDETPRILFACERYREGSDIGGLEMTSILMGNTIAANILVQIIGRALRADYLGKEGWCHIFRPSVQGTTAEDVWAKIMLEIADIMGHNEILNPKELQRIVETFTGSITMHGYEFNVQETIQRVQALYERRAWERGEVSYRHLRERVREEGISSEMEYHAKKESKGWPEDPKILSGFLSWFDLLRDNLEERPNLDDFKILVACEGIKTLEEYKQSSLPPLEHLLEGYIKDRPSPLPSFLESELFGSRDSR
jgi:superfamily II DNA or RNA helicase